MQTHTDAGAGLDPEAEGQGHGQRQVDDAVLAAVLDAFPPHQPLTTPDPAVAGALAARGRTAHTVDLEGTSDGALDALVLARDELSIAGGHAEALVADAARALRPGGRLLVSARNPLLLGNGVGNGDGPHGRGLRGFTSAGLRAALEHRGFAVDLVAAPGAGARTIGDGAGYRPDLDRLPGLLDAAPRVVAAGDAPASAAERSARFFATLPRKVVAAAVLCRDGEGRLLAVHDRFKDHWTIPGGVVDADEDPVAGAVREAREEAGVAVRVGALLGVFAATWPDRIVFVYAAVTADEGAPLRPLHSHEIGAAAWLPMDEASRRINPRTWWQIERCLQHPGGTWRH